MLSPGLYLAWGGLVSDLPAGLPGEFGNLAPSPTNLPPGLPGEFEILATCSRDTRASIGCSLGFTHLGCNVPRSVTCLEPLC